MAERATVYIEYDRKVEEKVRAELSLEVLAKFFCEMDAEQQGRFFVEVAKIGAAWPSGGLNVGAQGQWLRIGDYLRDHADESARDILLSIAFSLDHIPYNWEPTKDRVDRLPAKLRDYVRDLEANTRAMPVESDR